MRQLRVSDDCREAKRVQRTEKLEKRQTDLRNTLIHYKKENGEGLEKIWVTINYSFCKGIIENLENRRKESVGIKSFVVCALIKKIVVCIQITSASTNLGNRYRYQITLNSVIA